MSERFRVVLPFLIGFGVAVQVFCPTAMAQSVQAQSGSSTPQGTTPASLPEASGAAAQAAAALGAPTTAIGEAPTLERVLALARERAPEALVGRAEFEASRAVGVGARLSPLLNPYLEVIAERGNRGITQDAYITAQLHTPVEIAGQRSRRIAEADSFVELNAASLEQLRARIAGATVRAYGNCISFTARRDALTELLVSAATEADVLSARRDAGDATERDAQLARVERARIAVQLEETNADLGAALDELARLTGQRFRAPDTTHLFPQVNLTNAAAEYAPTAPAVQAAEAESRYFARMDERLVRERIPPLTVILQGGRGDFGETRLGAGLAWSLPAFRANQGERARAQADAVRARATAAAQRVSIAQRLNAIAAEGIRLRRAVERLDQEAIPAAAAATESATRMQRAGKTDLLSVVVARRDLYVLRLRRLEIAGRAWELLGDWIELTGRLPQ